MGLQHRICKAFCSDVRVNAIRGGFGVSTPFLDSHTGDVLGFYVLEQGDPKRFRLVDDALTVAKFESEGSTLDSQARLNSFREILRAYDGQYDEQTGELSIDNVQLDEVERKALAFMAMLLRLQDMYLITRERIKNTFADDVAVQLDVEAKATPNFRFEVGQPVNDSLREVIPDFVLRRDGISRPVALFLASNNEKLWQAMHLKLVSQHEAKSPVSVVALLEDATSGTSSLRAKASNRLDAMPNWRGDETAALHRVLSELDKETAQRQ